MGVFSSGTIIENKVSTTSLMTLVGSVGVAVLNAVGAHSELLGSLPALAQFIILAAIPPTITFLTGYVTPATPRPDLWVYQGATQPWLPDPTPAAAPPYHDEPYGPHDYDPEPTMQYRGGKGARHRA